MLTTRAAMPSLLELLVRVDAERHFAAGADQDHLRLAVRSVGQHIGAARDARGRRIARAVEASAAAGGSAPGRPADAATR